jgi:hypothetical protein
MQTSRITELWLRKLKRLMSLNEEELAALAELPFTGVSGFSCVVGHNG